MPKDEARYSNRQIEKFQGDQEVSFERQLSQQSIELKAYIDAALAPILVQTKLTNGRVTKTEVAVESNTDTIREIRIYAKLTRWAFGALWAIAAIVIGIIFK